MVQEVFSDGSTTEVVLPGKALNPEMTAPKTINASDTPQKTLLGISVSDMMARIPKGIMTTKNIKAGNVPPSGEKPSTLINAGKAVIELNTLAADNRENIEATTAEIKSTKGSTLFSSDDSWLIIKYKSVPAATTVAVPGKKKASSLFGVFNIPLAIYEAPNNSTGKSKDPIEMLILPVEIIFRAFIKRSAVTPITNTIIFGVA